LLDFRTFTELRFARSGLSWSAGLIVDRFGKPVEERLELIMVDDRQVVQHLGMTER
jgi:hypothetical protein